MDLVRGRRRAFARLPVRPGNSTRLSDRNWSWQSRIHRLLDESGDGRSIRNSHSGVFFLNDEFVRASEQLFGRITWILSLRLMIQPGVSIFLAMRAGIRDARNNNPAFLWEMVTNPASRPALIRCAWKDLGRLFFICVLVDTVYQVI